MGSLAHDIMSNAAPTAHMCGRLHVSSDYITQHTTNTVRHPTQTRKPSLLVTACKVLIATPALLIDAQALRHLMVPFFGTSELGKAAFIGTCIIDGRCIARLVLV